MSCKTCDCENQECSNQEQVEEETIKQKLHSSLDPEQDRRAQEIQALPSLVSNLDDLKSKFTQLLSEVNERTNDLTTNVVDIVAATNVISNVTRQSQVLISAIAELLNRKGVLEFEELQEVVMSEISSVMDNREEKTEEVVTEDKEE
jgi:hypothetical protein